MMRRCFSLALALVAVATLKVDPVVAHEANGVDPPKITYVNENLRDNLALPLAVTSGADIMSDNISFKQVHHPATLTRAGPITAIGDNADSHADFRSAIYETHLRFFYAQDDLANIGVVEPTGTSRALSSERRWRLHTEPID
jgi:hypothetical protein